MKSYSVCLLLVMVFVLIHEIDCMLFIRHKLKPGPPPSPVSSSGQGRKCKKLHFFIERDIKGALQAKVNIFLEIWESGDLDRLTQVYTKDVVQYSHHLPPIHGFEALLVAFKKLRQLVAKFDLHLVKAIRLSSTRAYSFDSGSTFNAEGKLLESDTRGLAIWKRVKGEWKIDVIMINSGYIKRISQRVKG